MVICGSELLNASTRPAACMCTPTAHKTWQALPHKVTSQGIFKAGLCNQWLVKVHTEQRSLSRSCMTSITMLQRMPKTDGDVVCG